MDRINHPTATPGRQFTEGDASSGTPATVVTAQFLNGVQEELVGVLEAAGLTPNASLVNQLRRAIFELTYPVGSYYFTRNIIQTPSQILGFGTWVALPAGRVPVMLDLSQTEFNAIGKTGGAKEHQLTAGQMPKHRHFTANTDQANNAALAPGNSLARLDDGGGDRDYELSGSVTEPTTGRTSETGNNEAHNNLQPYVVIGLGWYRTA